MLTRISSALRWVKAIDLTAAGEFAAARKKLAQIDVQRSGVRRYEHNLLYAYVLVRLNDPEAKRAVADSFKALDESTKLEAHERAYLKKYAQFVLASIFYSQENLEFSDIDLAKVPRRTMDLFPLRQHPDWRE